MEKHALKRLIRVASAAEPADLLIRNCRIVNVFTHRVKEGDIAICDGVIAGIGRYPDGQRVYDAGGRYALPGLIDSHIHIESSFLTPEQFGRVAVPHGTTTVIADPHEIVNVCGTMGLDYMLRAAERTALDVRYMIPSCVPCTEWEDSGAVVRAEQMRAYARHPGVGGIGEMMDSVGVLSGDDVVLDKLIMASEERIPVDGHAPSLDGSSLMGYLAAGIRTDHECGSIHQMRERLDGGMYVQLRYGSACRELPMLLEGLDEYAARRCLLCSDDRQSVDLLTHGDIDDLLRVCVCCGVDPITAVQMATLNAAECYGLTDRGAIAPHRRADIVLADDLSDFHITAVWIGGELVAEDGRYLLPLTREDPGPVANSMHVADFSPERLRLRLTSDRVHVIDVRPDTVVTGCGIARIDRDENGTLLYHALDDVARISVIERHHHTGKVANALIRGYGIRRGAIALTVGHDSHNILVVGVSEDEMAFAVEQLIDQRGGIVVTLDHTVLECLPLPIAGLMSDCPAEQVRDRLHRVERCAIEQLGVREALDPIVTLCFMSLPVIPELKLTDRGLFDVTHQRFLSIEAEEE